MKLWEGWHIEWWNLASAVLVMTGMELYAVQYWAAVLVAGLALACAQKAGVTRARGPRP